LREGRGREIGHPGIDEGVRGLRDWGAGGWSLNEVAYIHRLCSLGMRTQNICSSTHHIEFLNTCIEH
jgi:hypothetical protein